MYKVDIVNKKLIPLSATSFSSLGLMERFDIQEWVEKTPDILGEDFLVIGKEVTLASGKRLDLLCIDKLANLVIIELKRDESGSSVELQAIKYASYCSTYLSSDIYKQYATHQNITEDDAEQKIKEFVEVDIGDLNNSQRIILVSKEFNSEVISAVLWLRDFGVNIQCTRLVPYIDSDNQLFINPETIIPLPEARDYIERKERKQIKLRNQQPWTGYWFVNVGDGDHRTWQDNKKHGFIGAGQGKTYSSALNRLNIGDKIYAYMAGKGYVGFGEVTQSARMIKDFSVDGKSLLEHKLEAKKPEENMDSEELSEWVVGVNWIKTVESSDAKTFSGIFANPNIVCKLRHEKTLKFVQKAFGK